MVTETENMGLHVVAAQDLWDLFYYWLQNDVPLIDAHDHSTGKGVQIDHDNLDNIGTTSHADLDAHVASTSNPHSVSASQVGLGNVSNDAQVKASEKAAALGVATLNASSLVVQEPASKAQASGLASLDVNSNVVQNPASASATPGDAVIPIAGADGKLASGFLPETSSINPIMIQVFS